MHGRLVADRGAAAGRGVLRSVAVRRCAVRRRGRAVAVAVAVRGGLAAELRELRHEEGAGRQERGCLGEQVLALLDDEVLGIERLLGVHRRAVDRAAAALEAGRHVEQLLPGVLLDLLDPVGLGVLEVLDRLEPCAALVAGAQVLEEQVRRRDEHVAQLRRGHRVEEAEHDDHVDPPHRVVGRARCPGCAEGAREPRPHEGEAVGRVGRRRDARALEQEPGEPDQPEHDQREAVARLVLERGDHLRRLPEGAGRLHVAPPQEPARRDDQADAGQVHHQLVEAEERAVVELERRVLLDRDERGADEQHEERYEQELVHDARWLAHHAALAEAFEEGGAEASAELVEPILRLADADDPRPAQQGQDDRHAPDGKEDEGEAEAEEAPGVGERPVEGLRGVPKDLARLLGVRVQHGAPAFTASGRVPKTKQAAGRVPRPVFPGARWFLSAP